MYLNRFLALTFSKENDMTEEEIKKMALRFALEKSEGDAFDPFEVEYASEVLQWLTKDYCIVPKVEILNQHAWYMQRMKEVSSNRQMNRGKAIALENLFGKEMFEEDKK